MHNNLIINLFLEVVRMGVFKNLSSAIKSKSKRAAELSKALDSITESIKDEDKTWRQIYGEANSDVTLKKYCLKNKNKPHSIAGVAISTLVSALKKGNCLKACKAFLLKSSEINGDAAAVANIMVKRFKQLSNKSLKDDDRDLIEKDVEKMESGFTVANRIYYNRNTDNNEKFILSHRAKVKTVMEYPKVAESAVALLKAMNDRDSSSSVEYHLTQFSGSNEDFKAEKHIVIDEGVVEIPKDAFWGCDLESVKIPNTVNTIGENAFHSCENIEEIEIPNSVKIIKEYAFYGCINLENIKFEGNSIKNINSGAFQLSGLESIEFPNSVTTISKNTFSGCKFLKCIEIPSSVTCIEDGAFKYCKRLKKVTISTSVTEIGKYAFLHCEQLEKIVIPESVKKIGYDAFHKCIQLKEVTIPKSVDISSDGDVFSDCPKLKMIETDDGEKYNSIDEFLEAQKRDK